MSDTVHALQPEQPDQKVVRILLVEDEPLVRSLTSRILQRQGWGVVAVADGLAALQAWRCDSAFFDLVIVDVNMPGMNGYEVYRNLQGLNRQTRFLFVSGHLDLDVWSQLFGEQAPPLLTKPYSSQQLVGKVCALLEK
jgi:CheY-like chemotaxis protein